MRERERRETKTTQIREELGCWDNREERRRRGGRKNRKKKILKAVAVAILPPPPISPGILATTTGCKLPVPVLEVLPLNQHTVGNDAHS